MRWIRLIRKILDRIERRIEPEDDGGWWLYDLRESGAGIVIVPVHDWIPHDMYGESSCICAPGVEFFEQTGTFLFSHNSLDPANV